MFSWSHDFLKLYITLWFLFFTLLFHLCYFYFCWFHQNSGWTASFFCQRDMMSILDFLHPLPAACILVTFGVEALYTIVPHEGGIQALYYISQSRNTYLNPSNHGITILAETVLTTFLCFWTRGVAMGSNMSCNFASLYVGFLENIKNTQWCYQSFPA